ncbi:response regulator, partial [Thermoproteota archaeon]
MVDFKDSVTKKKILIVDDEQDIRDLLKAKFERIGYECFTAEDGLQALELAREKNPNLIVLDLMLPKLSGEEVCRDIKKNPATREIPVIMLTAKESQTDKVIGRVLGADHYLTKPCDVNLLVKE